MTKHVKPIHELLIEADELYTIRTMEYPEADRQLTGDQLEEFLESAEKEIKLRSELLDRECVKVGKTLSSVRQRIERSEFRNWVEKSCPFSYRTAQNYINLFRVTLDRPELLCLKKSVLYLIGAENFPEALCDYISDSLVGVYDIRLKDVLKMQTDYLNGDLDLESDEFTEHLLLKERDELHQLCEAGWQRIVTKLENEKKKFRSLIDRQKKIGAASYSNKFKRMWERTIEILDGTISDVKSLIQDGYEEADNKNHPSKSDEKVKQAQSLPEQIEHVQDASKARQERRPVTLDKKSRYIPDDLAAELKFIEECKELAPYDLTPIAPQDPQDDILDREYIQSYTCPRM